VLALGALSGFAFVVVREGATERLEAAHGVGHADD